VGERWSGCASEARDGEIRLGRNEERRTGDEINRPNNAGTRRNYGWDGVTTAVARECYDHID
jgi:hypothetical protein